MNILSSQPYKGTRDYFPEEKRVQNYIFQTWRSVVEQFGYEEYGAPMLEPLDLYAAKSGQELVHDQTYTFEDRGGRQVAIRPEMTPSISRMVAARRQELAYPARLYSIANFMRYERPQRGREREFWQLNVDLFGVDEVAADIEIVSIADAILKKFGAHDGDYVIRINNRKFISYMMSQYFDLEQTQAQSMIKLFDRRSKMTDQDFKDQAAAIYEVDIESPEFQARFEKINQLVAATTIDQLPEELTGSSELDELRNLFDGLKKAGVTAVIFDASLMRGLDYYTGNVFEVFDTHPDNSRSLFGGGRYDGLVGLFGAEPISAVGMAPGGTMIENFLTVHELLPVNESLTKIYIIVIDDALDTAQDVATKLRSAGVNAEVDITVRKIDKKIKTAIKKHIRHVLFVGANDSDTFSLKDLTTEQEEKLSISDISARFA